MNEEIGHLEDRCKKSIEHFKVELGKMRTGRASSGLLENLSIDYYGAQVPLMQIALINVPEPRLITVQVHDANAIWRGRHERNAPRCRRSFCGER